ncbi:DUF4266 domain-containing protein [Exilibacterium tricleocarpae]|uniref:DUF4266 domain-containing protein n=1 Tax=Exilibacterium tricleocarpae TaxID=2591008 RepID=A0A545TYZ9_9GAMM|nr:DUF4266 domain-containing protein [Exilibacterium tricleocarpae]TQV82450.1 DUF4266 domain-containing protein [Exilibacterium tricleocarpae]
MKRLTKLALLLSTAAIFTNGCSSIEPWVKPYERERLADPIMSLESHPVSTRYINHVYESREAARGAEGSAGGGCGCN